MILQAKPINAEDFACYGTLVSSAGSTGVSVNEGRGLRIETGAELMHSTTARQPTLALYRMQASCWPVRAQLMERHRLSAQMFVPLSGGEFLIVVAATLNNGEPDMDTAQAFACAPGQAIVYAPGVWHLPLVVLDQPAEFAMLMWEDGTVDDCDEHLLAMPIFIQSVNGV